MSSMLRSLTTLALAGSLGLLWAQTDVVDFVKRKLANNRQIKINSVKVADKLPIPGIKGWSAYIIALDLNLTRGKETRRVQFEDILFVSKQLITSELFDRKSGKDVRALLQPKMPKDIYNDAHLLYGDKNAPHKIIVFSDPLCPFCRMSVPDILKAAREHPDKIALYYYHLPLLGLHPASDTLVRVMEVAQKEGRRDIVEKMYKIKVDPNLKDEQKILKIVAEKLNYKLEPRELHQPWIDQRLKYDRTMARKLLVSGTPSVYVDGKKDVTRERYKSLIK